MGIRSTRTLTRKEAECLYEHFKLEEIRKKIEREIKYELSLLDNEALGDVLDNITTDIFSNYLVVDEILTTGEDANYTSRGRFDADELNTLIISLDSGYAKHVGTVDLQDGHNFSVINGQFSLSGPTVVTLTGNYASLTALVAAINAQKASSGDLAYEVDGRFLGIKSITLGDTVVLGTGTPNALANFGMTAGTYTVDDAIDSDFTTAGNTWTFYTKLMPEITRSAPVIDESEATGIKIVSSIKDFGLCTLRFYMDEDDVNKIQKWLPRCWYKDDDQDPQGAIITLYDATEYQAEEYIIPEVNRLDNVYEVIIKLKYDFCYTSNFL